MPTPTRRAADSTVARSHTGVDEGLAPGRSSNSARLTAPATPIESGLLTVGRTNGQNAAIDYQLTIAKQRDQVVTAPAYLHLHLREVVDDVRLVIGKHAPSTGHPRVAFRASAGELLDGVLEALRGPDTMACITRLRNWVAPADAFAIVDRARPIFEEADAVAGRPDDALRYGDGPKGPPQYRDAVGRTIGAELEGVLVGSLQRMAARLVVAADRKAPSQASVDWTDLVYSHPLDVHVGRAMLAHCEVTAGPADERGRITFRKVKRLEWMGKQGGPWNSVRSLDPVDANVEEIAAALTGKSTEAYRFDQIGPFFLVPGDIAAEIPEARDAVTPVLENQRRERLAFGPLAAASESAEAARVLAARGTRAQAPALAQQWLAIDEQLAALSELVQPYRLDMMLAPTRARHADHKSDLSTLAGHDALVRAALFTQQHELLMRVGAEIGELLANVRGSQVGALLRELVEVASLSHLVETSRTAYAKIKERRRHAVIERLEQQLGRANTQIEIIRRTAHKAGTKDQPVATEAYQKPADALAVEVAALRSRLLHGEPTPEDLQQIESIVGRLDALDFETRLLAEIGQLAVVAEALKQLDDTRWMRVTEWFTHTEGALLKYRFAAHRTRTILEETLRDWTAIERGVQEATAELATATDPDAALAAAKQLAPELAAIRAKLEMLASDREVAEFLHAAYEAIDDAQIRATITQISLMIGLGAVSAGIGAAAEGLALGFGASTLGAQIVGLTAESLTFSAVQSALAEDSLVTFATSFLGNFVTFGALRLTKQITAASWIGKTLGNAKAGARVATLQLWAAKAADVSAHVLVIAGIQYAQAQADSLIANGRTLTADEYKALATQGIAMMIGSLVAHRLLAHPMDDAKVWGVEHGARRASLAKLRELAARVEASGNSVDAVELMHGARTYTEQQQAKWGELARLSDGELSARGLSRGAVEALGQDATARLAELDRMEGDVLPAQLALDTVVPGHVYAGDANQVAQVADSYRTKGFHVETLHDGFRVSRVDRSSIKLVARQRDVVDLTLESASPPDRKNLEAVLALDPVEGRRLIREYGDDVAEHLRPNPLTTIQELESALKKNRKQVTDTVDGLYAGPHPVPPGWTFTTTGPYLKRGTTTKVVTTDVKGPNGAEGYFVRTYDPVTKELALKMAFLRMSGQDLQLPSMISRQPGAVEMIVGKGTPTVQYITMHQMQLLQIPFGGRSGHGVSKVHLDDIQNVETILQLHRMQESHGGDPSDLVEFTASMKYAETTVIQSGHERTGPPVLSGGRVTPIRELLEFQEAGNPERVAQHDKLLADYKYSRDTRMLWGFNIDFSTRPSP